MEDRLKIVMTADTVGGVWTYTMTLCKALGPYADIHLLTLGELMSDAQEWQVRQIENVTVYETNHKLEWMQDPWEDVQRTSARVDSLYRQVQPHFMHFNNYVQVQPGWNCPIITVFHSCVKTWFSAVKNEDAGPEWNRYTDTVARSLAASDVVVFPTHSLRLAAEQAYGAVPSAKVINNGSDPVFTIPARKESFIFTAGRVWDEAKNISFLAEIAPQLPWPLKVAGNAEAPDGGIFETANVELLGVLAPEEMQETLSAAGIFVSPAKYEPFGLAVLEAAAAGCALVLADIPTFRELWADAAVYFNPYDKDAAVKAITTVTSDRALREQLSQKAKAMAEGYPVQRMAEQYRLLYNQLAVRTAAIT